MKKVLFLIPSFDPGGGAEKVLLNLVNNMNYDEYDITVFALFKQNAMIDNLNKQVHFKSFLTHQFRGNSKLFCHIPASVLYRHIIRDEYDIIVSYLEGPSTYIVSGCNNNRTKKIAWVHIELHGEKKFATGFKTKGEALQAYRQMDSIICVSDSVKRAFEKSAGESFPQLQVLYNTNETAQILQNSIEKVDDIVFDNREINVISVAKIMRTKGYDRLAHVHKRLVDEGLRHHIYILGTGEMQKEIECYLRENKLTDSFTFIGFRSNPYKYVAKADFYICSSRVEGFSTAVTEALVVGTPVVSTNCSGAYELLGNNNEYGIVVDNSEQGIYEGMKTMIRDSELRKHYSIMAKERGQYFSTEKTVKAVEKLFLNLLD